MPLYLINGVTLDCNIHLPMPMLPGAGVPELSYEFESYAVDETAYWDEHTGAAAQVVERGEDGRITLRYWGGAWATLAGDRIFARSPTIFPDEYIHYRMLTLLLPYWQQRRGYACLHGSAVAWDGRAVGFIAAKHSGKTTLASYFTQRGHAFIADDAIALEAGKTAVLMHPSQPELRMGGKQAETLLGSRAGLQSIVPGREAKLGVAVSRLGVMQRAALPTAVLYLPLRRPSEARDEAIRIEALPPAKALLALLAHPSAGPELLDTALPETMLRLLPEVVRHVSVRRIEYPSGFQHLPLVYAAIRDNLANL